MNNRARWRVKVLVTTSQLDRGAMLRIMIGRGQWIGAGYINGLTMFFAIRSVSRRNMYAPAQFRVGVTRNGNNVPWLRY